MKKLLFIISFTFYFSLFPFTSASQPCLPDGINFSNQEQIDNFQIDYPNCTEIHGYVIIEGDDINNLNGLSVLTSVESYLMIGGWPVSNPILENLIGLTNLTIVNGGLNIGGMGEAGNPSLISLTGLENINTIGGLYVINNEALQNLTGLANLTSTGYTVIIENNDAMTSLAGLDNITTIESNLWIYGNDALMNLQGLNNLNTFDGYLSIEYNQALNEISALSNLTSLGGFINIDNNPSLTSLEGLNGISSTIGGVAISNNTSLLNLDGLNNLKSIGGGLNISGNHSIKNFSGLDQLTFLHGSFIVSDNLLLEDFNGLENLTALGGGAIFIGNSLYGGGNPQLYEISGLENLEAGSIVSLHIENNSSLSYCHINSVCNYLVAPVGTVEIHDNSSGCNSLEEVEEACETSVNKIELDDHFYISPNPNLGSVIIRYTISEIGYTIIDLYEISGIRIRQILNEEKLSGTHEVEIDLRDIPTGIYFCLLKTKNGIQTRKIIKL